MLPPIEELVRGRPDSLVGLPLEWLDDREPEPFFIRTFEVEDDAVYLFQAKHDVSRVLLDGEPLGTDGHFNEYFVVTGNAEDGWTVRRLLQRGGSVAYCTPEEDEPDATVQAREIKDPSALSLGDPPRWKASAAQWPTLRGDPMIFVGQTDPGYSTAFLFTHGEGSYKITMSDVLSQTAAEHYALEERLDSDLR
jgi:hypothetical protein